ncbi:serine-rich adhesin for platelets isoform X2 [Lucilia sericata]|uniref:serine-rich adhesin for platelets isoform X2 n=1 Tax=Lucilia sericata TaxID=13632 RepID=UPI0018A88039|nr:serine-rich adhesin for platelets isoform X2 [Lucilia sericata]
MLVATPGQTTAYSTIHNNNNNNSSSNGGGVGSNTVAAATTTKKSNSLNSTNTTASGTPKSLNNNNSHTAAVVANKNSLNSNTQQSYHNHTNLKHDSIVSHKLQQQNKMTATSSREAISSNLTAAATTHSLKNENSTSNTNTTNNTTTTNIITSNSSSKQQSFIQTLKDSVQKALITTTGTSGSGHNSIVTKLSTDNKLPTNSNNLTTSIHNVTSSSAATTHNATKVSTTTTSTNSSNSTAATQSLSSSTSSSVSLVRSKYFSCSLSKLHTVAPTIIHRYPEERQHASSTDSLQKEMCHFKPIRIVPTTPWKSGSKSRGNSLRFPKANLATKKTEFVLKSNCDVNNRKKRQQQNRTQTDKINLDKDDDNEQENKEFHGIYKPKPSLTCLSTSVTTPNHQSAFVCLVAQMKSLVNLQSKKQQTPNVVEGGNNETIKELYVRKKPANRKSLTAREIESAKELSKSRTTRLTLNKRVSNSTTNNKTTTLNTSKENVKRTNAKSNNSISKSSTAAITKAKSRRKLGRAKSKTINLVNLASTRGKGKLQNSVSMPAVVSNEATATATVNKRSRKRKLDPEEDEITSPNKITSSKSLALGARKSTRLSKDMTSNTFKSPITTTNLKTSQRTRKNPTTVVCFSPPLTRSRLKHLAEQGSFLNGKFSSKDNTQ